MSLAFSILVFVVFSGGIYGGMFYLDFATEEDRVQLIEGLNIVPLEVEPEARRIVEQALGRKNLQKRHCSEVRAKLQRLSNRSIIAKFEAPGKAKDVLERYRLDPR